jgi:hypothetical protein
MHLGRNIISRYEILRYISRAASERLQLLAGQYVGPDSVPYPVQNACFARNQIGGQTLFRLDQLRIAYTDRLQPVV